MSTILLTEDQCNHIINSIQTYFYATMIKECNEYVWKKPDYMTLRDLTEIIMNTLDHSYNEPDMGYIG